MTLKAILFNFNGVIINDDFVHQQLIDDILLGENLSASGNQYQQFCLGKNDRVGLKNLFAARGRILTDKYLDKLLLEKATAYQNVMSGLQRLPIINQVVEFILQTQTLHLPLALVTGTSTPEVEYVLQRANLRQYFTVIISGDEIATFKPAVDGYLLAVEKLNQLNSTLNLKPSECLAIEDTPLGISAAKNAGIQVVGVANTYPFHMLQRQCNWCVDNLMELDLEWVQKTLTTV